MAQALIALITVLTLPLGVSAQGNEVVTFVYNGSTLVALHNGNIVFQPGNTQAGTVVLEAPVEFSVVSFVDRTALEAGNRLGGAEAECTSTLAGQRCSVEVAGTGDQLWLEVVLAPTSSLTEVSYGGSAIALLHGGNFVFRPGSTVAAASPLNANHPFVLVSYADRSALEAGAPLGSIAASCNTIVGAQCAASIAGTGTNTLVKIQSADFQLPAATPSAQLTATPNPLLGVQPQVTSVAPAGVVVGVGGLPTATSTSTQNGWNVQYFTGATADMLAYQFPVLNPALWSVFPNVDFAAANFLAANGLEYGEDESQTCGSADDLCDLVVAARSYVLISGDYALEGIGTCTAINGRGCSLMIVNVGDVSAEFTGILNNVFIIQGRYWNGDRNFLPSAIVAGLSHSSHNMLNLDSVLNPAGGANAGANCSVPGGCIETDSRGIVTSGNQPLVGISTVGHR